MNMFSKTLQGGFKIFRVLFVFIFLTSFVFPTTSFAVDYSSHLFGLPNPGTLMYRTEVYKPVLVQGLSIDLQNPFRFGFIVNPGDEKADEALLKEETMKMARYFLAALTVPEKEMWVNLSPYESDRIIPEQLGLTELGRDLLAQDYLLKQISSSLTSPEDDLGREFWQRVYRKAAEEYGTTEIPFNTFNKVWILPEKADVYEHENNVLIVESRLKVMMEEDYLARESSLETRISQDCQTIQQGRDAFHGSRDTISAEVFRNVVLPEIEKEVNEGRSFAGIRQIYHAMILAAWYKQNLKESILGQIYVDQKKIAGVDVEDKTVKEKIYQQYLEAFRKGVFNFIREDRDPAAPEPLPRKYFSGGAVMNVSSALREVGATTLLENLKGTTALTGPLGQILMVIFNFTAESSSEDISDGKKNRRDRRKDEARKPKKKPSSQMPVREWHHQPGKLTLADVKEILQGVNWKGRIFEDTVYFSVLENNLRLPPHQRNALEQILRDLGYYPQLTSGNSAVWIREDSSLQGALFSVRSPASYDSQYLEQIYRHAIGMLDRIAMEHSIKEDRITNIVDEKGNRNFQAEGTSYEDLRNNLEKSLTSAFERLIEAKNDDDKNKMAQAVADLRDLVDALHQDNINTPPIKSKIIEAVQRQVDSIMRGSKLLLIDSTDIIMKLFPDIALTENSKYRRIIADILENLEIRLNPEDEDSSVKIFVRTGIPGLYQFDPSRPFGRLDFDQLFDVGKEEKSFQAGLGTEQLIHFSDFTISSRVTEPQAGKYLLTHKVVKSGEPQSSVEIITEEDDLNMLGIVGPISINMTTQQRQEFNFNTRFQIHSRYDVSLNRTQYVIINDEGILQARWTLKGDQSGLTYQQLMEIPYTELEKKELGNGGIFELHSLIVYGGDDGQLTVEIVNDKGKMVSFKTFQMESTVSDELIQGLIEEVLSEYLNSDHFWIRRVDRDEDSKEDLNQEAIRDFISSVRKIVIVPQSRWAQVNPWEVHHLYIRWRELDGVVGPVFVKVISGNEVSGVGRTSNSGSSPLAGEELDSQVGTASAPTSESDAVGGIDLIDLNLRVRRDGKGMPLPVSQQPFVNMNIDGFVPVLINIQPVNLPLLLGIKEEPGDSEKTAAFQTAQRQ